MAQILVAGLGDIGTALSQWMMVLGHHVSAIRRGEMAPSGVHLLRQDLLGKQPLTLPEEQVDLLYIILTPDSRDQQGYEQAFLKAPVRLLDALSRQQPLPPVIFVSSTSVYGNDSGEVDEETIARPEGFNGEVLIQAEEAIAARTLATMVRFSGIYGPGRLRLLRQLEAIQSGETPPPSPRFTNRIHSEDCVGLLAHLGNCWLSGEIPPPLIIGADNQPVINTALLNWLSEQTAQPLDLPVPDIAPGKRIYSRYLQNNPDWQLRYPDFRAGYQALLDTATRSP